MKVIAIDPSINNIGWAIAENGSLIDSGLIKTKGKTDGEKLFNMREQLYEVISHQTPIYYAYVDRTLYKGMRKNIQTIFKFAKAIGHLEYCFEMWGIPIKQPSLKLARKLTAIDRAITIMINQKYDHPCGKSSFAIPLTTHEAEAIVWAIFYSREMEGLVSLGESRL